MDRVKRIWYFSEIRIRAVSPEPSLLAHTSSESRGTLRQKARSLAPLNGWACAVKICHYGMLEDTNSLDGAHIRKKLVALFLAYRLANHKYGKFTDKLKCILWDFDKKSGHFLFLLCVSKQRTTKVLIRLRGCAG